MKPAPGIHVTRNVKLVRPLGKGGMGSVWVGEHTTLDTEVAVKFISPEHAEKKRFVARFRREASSAAKIKSPHVVQVFDHGITEERVPYIVMELLEGESLAKRLRRERLSPREVAMLVAQVSKVLTTAHDLGIVHRDLKPDNLFLVESGYELFVKVLDFGIAKQLTQELNEITDTGAMVGTPYYMSPEMLLSPKDADHRADLWALAVVAYHATTGELPFRGETLAALSVAVNDGAFTPPSALVPELGPEVDVWFKLALCRNIDGRFQNAAEMSQSLRQALMESGDMRRSSQPIDSDSLPESARPSDIDTTTEAQAAAVDPTEDEAATRANADGDTESTADPTVTSEQLAQIRSGDDASGDADTLAAAKPTAAAASSTLEGTTSSGSRERPAWGVRVGIAAAATLLVGGTYYFAQSEPTSSSVPLSSSIVPASARTPSSATSSARPPPPTATGVSATPSAEESGAEETSPMASTPAPSKSPKRTTQRPAAPRPPVRPAAPKPSAKPRTKCAEPFYVDEHGDLQPRPGCF
jgi:serine/threonine-protein kinase